MNLWRVPGPPKGEPRDNLGLEIFFVNYHGMEGKKYKLLGCKGEDAAWDLVKKAKKAKKAAS